MCAYRENTIATKMVLQSTTSLSPGTVLHSIVFGVWHIMQDIFHVTFHGESLFKKKTPVQSIFI